MQSPGTVVLVMIANKFSASIANLDPKLLIISIKFRILIAFPICLIVLFMRNGVIKITRFFFRVFAEWIQGCTEERLSGPIILFSSRNYTTPKKGWKIPWKSSGLIGIPPECRWIARKKQRDPLLSLQNSILLLLLPSWISTNQYSSSKFRASSRAHAFTNVGLIVSQCLEPSALSFFLIIMTQHFCNHLGYSSC